MTDPARTYQQAIDAFNHRDWRRVLECTARLLPTAPRHDGLHYLSGIASLELQMFQVATQHLGQAARIVPAHGGYAVQHARALLALRMTNEALTEAQRALALKLEDPAALDTLGVVLSLCNAQASAVQAFRRAAELAPRMPQYRFNYATALVAAGELELAEEETERCLELDPKAWNAHLTLAQLRKQTTSSNHIPRLEHLLSEAHGDLRAQMCLHLALAKEYEDVCEYPKAFEHLTLGKSVAGRQRNYVFERDEAMFNALTKMFDSPVTHNNGADSDEPIFVIGMPRSGTTLVERIISNHPDVLSAGELQNFGVALKWMSGSRTPPLLDADTVERCKTLDWQALGREYLQSTRPLTGSRPHFVDKLPHNFLFAGFIARALPNARIVCLRRNPLDTCLSNFRQLFALNSSYYDYSYDLLDTGRYYVLFDRLLAHWQRVLPGRVLEVSYEALVDDQENITRRIVEFCKLPWNDACLRFHENDSPVATASAVQVREPMNRRSVDRWRRYEPQLGELKSLLRTRGIDIE